MFHRLILHDFAWDINIDFTQILVDDAVGLLCQSFRKAGGLQKQQVPLPVRGNFVEPGKLFRLKEGLGPDQRKALLWEEPVVQREVLDRSFAALKAKFPTWLEVAHADESSIEKAIRCGGLAKIKAKNIRTILLDLEQRANGAPSLDYMATMSDKDVFSELTKMKGVGPKTAACVLLFSMGRQACGSPSITKPVFNRNAFPVDTHVHRVSRRLGLVSFDSSREQTQEKLEGKVPTDWMYKVFSLNSLFLTMPGPPFTHSTWSPSVSFATSVVPKLCVVCNVPKNWRRCRRC